MAISNGDVVPISRARDHLSEVAGQVKVSAGKITTRSRES
jgi:hypothetical protein